MHVYACVFNVCVCESNIYFTDVRVGIRMRISMGACVLQRACSMLHISCDGIEPFA